MSDQISPGKRLWVLRIRLSSPADSSVLVITIEWHLYSFTSRVFVDILFCYINGVVLICDWNENIERLSLGQINKNKLK